MYRYYCPEAHYLLQHEFTLHAHPPLVSRLYCEDCEFHYNIHDCEARKMKPASTHCTWSDKDYGYDNCWTASCSDHLFCFTEGSPKENHFAFCPYCGKPIQEKSNA